MVNGLKRNANGADIQQFIVDIRSKLNSEIRKAIHNGWVLESQIVDENTDDRFLHILIRLNLTNLNEEFNANATILVYCRFLADKGLLSVKDLEKTFDISVQIEEEDLDYDTDIPIEYGDEYYDEAP